MTLTAAITAVSQQMGIPYLSPDLIDKLAKDGESHINLILEYANRIRKHKFHRKLRAIHINESLENKKMEPIHGYDCESNSPELIEAGKVDGSETYVYKEHYIDFKNISREPLVKYPIEISYTFHWLAVDGIQPKIEENQFDLGNEFSVTDKLFQIPSQVHLSDQPYLIISSNNQLPDELQKFFTSTRDKISESQSLKDLSHEPCIQQLLPYFFRFFYGVMQNGNLRDYINRVLTPMRWILKNPNINCEHFVYSFLSIALSMILYPDKPPYTTELIQIREMAADFIGVLLNKFNTQYPDIRHQLAEELITVLFTEGMPLASQYGAIVTFESLGADTIHTLLLPHLPRYFSILQSDLDSEETSVRQYACYVKAALQRVCGLCFNRDTYNNYLRPKISVNLAELYDQIAQFFGYRNFICYISDPKALNFPHAI